MFHRRRQMNRPDQLPLGALPLDSRGRVLPGHGSKSRGSEVPGVCLTGLDFFEHHLGGPRGAELREVYLSGVRNGRLYHFVDLGGPEAFGPPVTLFLYYHQATQQGWVFIERRLEATTATPHAHRAAA